jgi:hypothetical protein
MENPATNGRKYVPWLVFAFTAGLAVGIWGTDYVVSRNTGQALGMALMDEMSRQERFAIQAFKEFDAATSIVVQEALLDTVVKRHQFGWLSDKDLYRITGAARARIAVASLELNKTSEANKQLEQAVVELKRAGVPADKESLVTALSKERLSR